MDIVERERKQWGDIIQKLKKEKVQAVIEKTRKKFEEVYIIIQNETLLR